jgi:hypothetical protein
MLCELDFKSSLIDVSSLSNSRFTLCSVSCACCFDFSSKPFAKFKISLINHSFQSDIFSAVRIGNADTVFGFPRHAQAVTLQLLNHILPAADLTLLHQVHQAGGDFLCGLLFIAG